MKITTDVRHRLLRGEAVELTLTDRPAIKQDGVYVLKTDKGTHQGHYRVLVLRKQGSAWRALIRYEGDPVLLPAKGNGYTDYSGRAMPRGDEPGPELEAVDAETQQRFSDQSRKEWDAYMQETRPEEVAERKMRLLKKQMAWVQAEAMKRGVDISPQLEACIEDAKGRLVAERQAA